MALLDETIIANQPGHILDSIQLAKKLNGLYIDVRADCGGAGLGIADEEDVIEDAMALAEATGIKIVRLGPGNWRVSQYENPDHADIWSAIQIRNGVMLLGAGEQATTITLADNQASHPAAHIISNRDQAGDNQNIWYEGFTLDGNAANQDELMMGILTTRTRGVTYRNITVKNVYGTANTPPGETFHIENSFCTDVHHENCSVFSDDGGPTATAFSCDVSTNITYVGCRAYGMEHGHGFTHWHCANITYTGCFGFLNGDIGFNSEFSRDIKYIGCHGGGTSNDEEDSYPYAVDTVLGNGGHGFVINATVRAELVACTAAVNGGNGLAVVNTGATMPQVTITGGYYTANDGFGIYFGPDDDVAPRCRMSRETVIELNGIGDVNIGTSVGTVGSVSYILPGITIPATTVAWNNPYPWDVEIYSYGGGNLDFLNLQGANIIGDVRHFRVSVNGYATPNYSGAAPGTWVAARC